MKAKRWWQYPMTFFTALRVEDLVGQKLREWVDYSPKFMKYLKLAERASSAEFKYETVREARDLPWIPFTSSEPWLHQLQAYHFAYPREAAMLDMDMGTGKTKVVFDLIANRQHFNTLVIAPPGILGAGVWEEQAIKHWPREAGTLRLLNLYEGNLSVAKRTERAAEWLSDPSASSYNLILINYEAVWRSPFKEWAKKQLWDLVVLEESHRAKKAGGKGSFAISDIGRRAKYRIAMSGTPMAHSPLDIYAQYRFLDSGIFGTSAGDFRARYAVFGGFQNREVIGFQNEDDLQRRFYSIAFHVDESVQSLPPKLDIDRAVQLEPSAKAAYMAMSKEMVAEFDGRQATAGNTLTKVLRLQQITGGHVTLDPEDDEAKGPIRVVSEAKYHALVDILEDLDPDDPVVVFTKFIPDMEVVRAACEATGRSFAEYSGQAKQFKRWKRGGANVLGAQIRTGSEGLDMTRARYAIYYSLTHSLADYKQSRKRVHRPGQTRPTTFFHLVATGTIDREIMTALEKRQNVIQYILKSNFFSYEQGEKLYESMPSAKRARNYERQHAE